MLERIEKRGKMNRMVLEDQQDHKIQGQLCRPTISGRAGARAPRIISNPMIPVTTIMQMPAAPDDTDSVHVSRIPSRSFSFRREQTGERILQFRSSETYTSIVIPRYRIHRPERMALTNPVRALASATWLYPFKVRALRRVTSCA